MSFGAGCLGSVFALGVPGRGGSPFAVRPKRVGSLLQTGWYRVLPGASMMVRQGRSMSGVCAWKETRG